MMNENENEILFVDQSTSKVTFHKKKKRKQKQRRENVGPRRKRYPILVTIFGAIIISIGLLCKSTFVSTASNDKKSNERYFDLKRDAESQLLALVVGNTCDKNQSDEGATQWLKSRGIRTLASSDFTSEGPDFSTISDFVEKFGALAGDGFDKVGDLREIASGCHIFLRVVGPAARVFALTLKTTFDVKDDTYKAVVLLGEKMVRHFNKMENKAGAVKRALIAFTAGRDYAHNIKDPIRFFEIGANFSRNLTFPFEERNTKFLKICSESHSDPRETLAYMNQRFVTDCDLPNSKETQNYVAIYEVFINIEDKWNNLTKSIYLSEFSPVGHKWEQAKTDFIYQTKRLPSDKVTTATSKLKTLIGKTPKEALSHLEKLVNKEQQTRNCLLEAVMAEQEYETKFLMGLGEVVRIDALILFVNTVFCVKAEGASEETQKKEIGDAEKYYEQILNHTDKWIGKKLRLAWPEVALLRAKEAIGTEDIPTSEYGATAQKIANEVSKLGEDKYGYNVVITSPWESPKYWAIRGTPDWVEPTSKNSSAFLMNYQNGNIVICRYTMDEVYHNQVKNAATFFHNKKKAIQEVITKQWSSISTMEEYFNLTYTALKENMTHEWRSQTVVIVGTRWAIFPDERHIGYTHQEYNYRQTVYQLDVELFKGWVSIIFIL